MSFMDWKIVPVEGALENEGAVRYPSVTPRHIKDLNWACISKDNLTLPSA